MIQRIQTVYLVLAAISIGNIILAPLGYQETEAGVVASIGMMENLPSIIISALGVLLAIIDIFLFNNRKLQLKVTSLFIVLGVLSFASLALFHLVTGVGLFTKINYVPYVLAFFSITFGVLAHRGINADEKLVRSMDRLR